MNNKVTAGLTFVLAILLIAGMAERATGDVTIVSRTVTKMPRGVSEDGLETVVYMKGPWLRRESHGGAGMLAGMLGAKTTIVNRVSGQVVTLYPEEKQYQIDTLDNVSCGLEELADLSWLGVNRGRLSASVSFPDTEMTACGCKLRPVQIELSPKGLTYAGRTTLRLWMCSDFESAFGKSFRQDLFCGDAPDDSASLDRMSASWQAQLGLSVDDAAEIRGRVRGIPFVMESFSIRDTVVLTSTTITTTSIAAEPLPDSLFIAPADYGRRVSDKSRSDEEIRPDGGN